MRDKELRKELEYVGVIENYGRYCSSNYNAQCVIDGGFDKYKVMEHEQMAAEVEDMRKELNALYNLLGIERKSCEHDYLQKGAKKESIK